MRQRYIVFLGLVLVFILFFRKIAVLSMIGVGAIFFPEASKALRHYCFGDGSRLVVESNYIQRSPVVLRHLKGMRVGQRKKVGFHQWEDWRLSFALNPFTIERRKDKVIIRQWMAFDNTGKVWTWLFFIPVPDVIVHTFECTPYEFYSEFPYNSSGS